MTGALNAGEHEDLELENVRPGAWRDTVIAYCNGRSQIRIIRKF
jgi:hypothetical protein